MQLEASIFRPALAPLALWLAVIAVPLACAVRVRGGADRALPTGWRGRHAFALGVTLLGLLGAVWLAGELLEGVAAALFARARPETDAGVAKLAVDLVLVTASRAAWQALLLVLPLALALHHVARWRGPPALVGVLARVAAWPVVGLIAALLLSRARPAGADTAAWAWAALAIQIVAVAAFQWLARARGFPARAARLVRSARPGGHREPGLGSPFCHASGGLPPTAPARGARAPPARCTRRSTAHASIDS